MKIFDHATLWAACCLAYFGFLRSAEFTVPNMQSYASDIHLSLTDIAVDSMVNPSCLSVFIKASKTDPFRRGTHIFIGKGNPPVCAVSAMPFYINVRGSSPCPLFILRSGQPLSRDTLTKWLKDILSLAGIVGNYSSHSFRIGAATVAARNGLPDHLIQSFGRWSSNAYQGYIRTPTGVLASAAASLS